MRRTMHCAVGLGIAISMVMVLSGCGGGAAPAAERPATSSAAGAGASALVLTSTAFAHEDPIPSLYACDGDNISPPLQWDGVPEGTASLALIVDDPDAPVGTFVHWVLYNLPAEARGLDAGVPVDAELPDGSMQGRNGARRTGYTGPCPPSGTHRYYFKLYALDTALDLAPDAATKDEVLAAMEGHVLAQTELMGRYQRQ